MGQRLKTAVVGATGYAGFELARLLSRHPRLETPALFRRESDNGEAEQLADLFPACSGNGALSLRPFSWSEAEQAGVELLFLATPHEASRQLVPEALSRGLRVVDLSGAWRLKRPQHQVVYGFPDTDGSVSAELLRQAVYGLPELNRGELPGASLVANPGCYATSVILGVAPLLQAGVVDCDFGVISDSKSGVSGAGKEPSARTHFVSVADNLSAYSVFAHRHVAEIVEQLDLETEQLTFTPHLLPIPRGILSTIYLRLLRPMTSPQVEDCFRQLYCAKRWVRILPPPRLPQIQFSLHSNFCDIGFCLADDHRRLVVVSCLDNLLKGAAGQAVQNMNLMYGWNEEEGLH